MEVWQEQAGMVRDAVKGSQDCPGSALGRRQEASQPQISRPQEEQVQEGTPSEGAPDPCTAPGQAGWEEPLSWLRWEFEDCPEAPGESLPWWEGSCTDALAKWMKVKPTFSQSRG